MGSGHKEVVIGNGGEKKEWGGNYYTLLCLDKDLNFV